MSTNCQKRAKEGVVDMVYIERRLDTIEARIDDLCGLLGEVLEKLGVGEVDTKPEHPCQVSLFVVPDNG